MSYLINDQQKINDIVFEKRNKVYGAYAIRSTYGNTVFRSLAFMMLGFGTIMSLAFYFSNRPDGKSVVIMENEIQDSIYVMKVDVEPKVEPQQPQQHSENPGNQSSVGTVINETLTAETSTSTALPAGPTNTAATGDGPPGTTLTAIPEATAVSTPSIDAPFLVYDSPPEFDGGLQALYRILGENLKYPDMAREIGKEGTVYVKFVVDQNGKVGNLTLLNTVGYGFDEEAMRVVGKLPNFKKPGMVNGKAVKVYFQLPIKFRIK